MWIGINRSVDSSFGRACRYEHDAACAHTALIGTTHKAVLDQLAIPHWNANHSQPYNGQIGHVDTHGHPGNWHVTVMVYATAYGPLQQEFRCRYSAHVTGSEGAPVVTQTAAPSCGYYNKVRPS